MLANSSTLYTSIVVVPLAFSQQSNNNNNSNSLWRLVAKQRQHQQQQQQQQIVDNRMCDDEALTFPRKLYYKYQSAFVVLYARTSGRAGGRLKKDGDGELGVWNILFPVFALSNRLSAAPSPLCPHSNLLENAEEKQLNIPEVPRKRCAAVIDVPYISSAIGFSPPPQKMARNSRKNQLCIYQQIAIINYEMHSGRCRRSQCITVAFFT